MLSREEYMAVQTALIKEGFNVGKAGADGKWGSSSKKALKAFQIAKGLTADGVPGDESRGALGLIKAPVRGEDLPHFNPTVAAKDQAPLQKDCMSYYGGVGLHQKSLILPFAMKLAWDKKVLVNKISIHERAYDSAGRAFDKIAKTFSPDQRIDLGLDLFGGSLNVRKMRGGNSYSMHSWGIAIDFDPERNQLKWNKNKARLGQPDAIPFWEIWESEGWVSLGRAANYDWMHVQRARLK